MVTEVYSSVYILLNIYLTISTYINDLMFLWARMVQ